MAYIYQIKNDINDKVYIGKTEFSLEKRFKEHCNDAFRREEEHRPLYSAMRKYGIEHFDIELIEETDRPEEREIYWIEQKRSFKNGYNATIGGDGKKYLDYDLIITTYNQTHSIIDTAKLVNCSIDSVSNVLKESNYKTFSAPEVIQEKYGIIVNQYDLQNNYIQSFPSYKAAATSVGKEHSNGAASHIADACKGKRMTAYGYIWKFDE